MSQFSSLQWQTLDGANPPPPICIEKCNAQSLRPFAYAGRWTSGSNKRDGTTNGALDSLPRIASAFPHAKQPTMATVWRRVLLPTIDTSTTRSDRYQAGVRLRGLSETCWDDGRLIFRLILPSVPGLVDRRLWRFTIPGRRTRRMRRRGSVFCSFRLLTHHYAVSHLRKPWTSFRTSNAPDRREMSYGTSECSRLHPLRAIGILVSWCFGVFVCVERRSGLT